MNRTFVTFLLLFGLSTTAAWTSVKVTALDFTPSGATGAINIAIEGRSSELPDIKVEGKLIQVTIHHASDFKTISRDVRGAKLLATYSNGRAVIKATLPYDVPADAVNLGWNKQNIEVIFPRAVAAANSADHKVAAKPVTAPAAAAVAKDTLNEDYLNKIITESNARTEPGEVLAIEPAAAKDEVKLLQAAPVLKLDEVQETRKSDNFSFAGYAVKFTAFLALVLALFYGIVQLLKKGVFNRGKLGFLNNAQMIQVLSTTYVSPKRSLMVVKAHNQIFLVANSENGLQFLSEMKDTSGLIKAGEKLITGSNFDSSLADHSELEEFKVKMKENIMESTPVEDKPLKLSPARDIVKFSEELKKKAKKLKPIEFN
jgi:flagellar biogenesis protein FliO